MSATLDAAPQAPAKNPFQRMAGALFAPAETFADIARKPDFLVPLIVFVLIGYATSIFTVPRLNLDAMLEQQHEAMRAKNPQLTDKDFESMDRFTIAITKFMSWIGPLLGIALLAALAAIFYLAFRLMGGEGTFPQAFSATLYAWMPMVIFSIVMTVVIVARGSWDPTLAATLVKSNPAFLVDMKAQPALFSLLASLDIFTIWVLVLFTYGYAAMSRFSRAKSAAIVFTLYFVFVFVKVGFAALAAGMQKS